MQIEPVNIIQAIFVFQSVFGGLLLWQQKRYRGLVFLLLLVAINSLFNLLEEVGNSRNIYLVTPVFLLGKGALFYLFVYRLVYPDKNFVGKQLWHVAPMLVALPFTQWPQFIIALGSLSQIIYAYFTIRLVYRYRHASFATRSDAETLQIGWVIKVLVAFLVIGLIDLIRLNLQPYIPLSFNLGGQLFDNLVSLFLVSYLIYKAAQRPGLYNEMDHFEQGQEANAEKTTKNSSIVQQIFNNLEEIIKTNTLHQQPRLSLNDLADETGLNQKDISQAINQIAGISFCDYINRLRVAEVKKRLQKSFDNKYSLLDIAFEAGFNSKSSFNAVFKRETGMTPSQYINQE